MSFICHRPLNPNISHVDQLYMDGSANGHMYFGSGTPPPCSSSHPPPPSNCTVCFNRQSVYAICSDLPKNAPLMMEGDGQLIDLIDSTECPVLLATNENADLFGADMGAQHWWWLLLLIPIMIVIHVVVVVVVVARKKYAKKIQERMKMTPGRLST